MSKRFKVEHNDMEKGVLYITLHHPPYNDEDILSKINWKQNHKDFIKWCNQVRININTSEEYIKSLDLYILSHGGVGSNYIIDYLQKMG